jgi:uncharacterized protein
VAEAAARYLQPLPLETTAAAAIEPLDTTVTAFIGRCLRGPLNTPTTITSFMEFLHSFGGLWQPSMLSYAVEQFFEQGGSKAIIVRVVNGARPPTLTLSTGEAAITLRGLAPGTREYLRASVDYDGIDPAEVDRFNLIVQRVREPGTEQIEFQEIFRRVSLRTDSDRYLADALAHSQLLRFVSAATEERPVRTPGATLGSSVGYIDSNTDGDDGGVLCDYDLIGSAEAHTGLFALAGADEHFSMLCMPPLDRDRDVGYPALVVASRICRQRQVLLIVDPPAAWDTPEAALAGLAAWPFQSPDACMYFPRVTALDRLRGRTETFASCGAAAGMMAHADGVCPVWGAAAGDEALLRAPLRLSVAVSEQERDRLGRMGVNTLRSARTMPAPAHSPRTLVTELSAKSDLRFLSVRRLGQYVTASILRGTRWALLQPPGAPLWLQLRAQVEAFLESVAQQGALVGDKPQDSYFVICDERINGVAGLQSSELHLLFGFAALRPGEYQAYLISHRAGGSSIRAVSVNRVFTGGKRADEEFETGILRGILAGS